MSTFAYVKKLLGVTGGSTKLYRDRIMDAGFLAEFDFVSNFCNGGVTSGAASSSFNNLVDSGAAATVAATITNGIGAHGLDFSAGASGRVALPGSAFKFAADEQHFAVGVVITPDPAPGNSKTIGIAGYSSNTSTDSQWYLGAVTNSSGVYTSARFSADGLGPQQTTGLGWLTDGKPHFMVGEWEVVGTLAWRRLYVDGVLVASISATYDTSLTQVTNTTAVAQGPTISGIPNFSIFTGKVGRIWSKKWATGGSAIGCADIAKREFAYYGPSGSAVAMFGSGYASTLVGAVDANRYG